VSSASENFFGPIMLTGHEHMTSQHGDRIFGPTAHCAVEVKMSEQLCKTAIM